MLPPPNEQLDFSGRFVIGTGGGRGIGAGIALRFSEAGLAVINNTRSLASDWAEYNNVNAVCPGDVATPMLFEVAEWISSRSGGDPKELLENMVNPQFKRHIPPIEVRRTVAFLLSDYATIIRGQAINIDRGDTLF